MRAMALLTALLVAGSARGQARLTPEEVPAPEPSCFLWGTGTRLHAHSDMGVVGQVGSPSLPSGSTQAASSADAPLSGVSGGGSGEAFLALVVVAAVALPVIVYAVDEDADEKTLFRYGCPTFQLELSAGAVSTPVSADAWAPLGGFRLMFAQGPLGLDASLESTLDPRHYGAMDAHLLLRPPPKRHIEGALALGVRRVVFGGAERNGFELALPHRYVISRAFGGAIGFDLRPAVFVGTRGVDYRVEGGMTFPIGFTSFKVGVSVFSFDTHVRAGAYAGIGTGI